MTDTPTVPTEYPWWMHHPTQPMVLTQTADEAQALVDADPLWRLWPYPEEEKPVPGSDPGAALAAQAAPEPPSAEDTTTVAARTTVIRRRS